MTRHKQATKKGEEGEKEEKNGQAEWQIRVNRRQEQGERTGGRGWEMDRRQRQR